MTDRRYNHSVHRYCLNTRQYRQCRHHNIAIWFEHRHHKSDCIWPMGSTRTIVHSLEKKKMKIGKVHVTLIIYQKWTGGNLRKEPHLKRQGKREKLFNKVMKIMKSASEPQSNQIWLTSLAAVYFPVTRKRNAVDSEALAKRYSKGQVRPKCNKLISC